ncbi:uncharacterized protein TNCV_1529191 [Trichonephila clavipes]|uniref:Uncharacterized protein n=1 Tax=Trichonephila clavipes TaxID=2585209 RepID=A0A8X6SMG2_TRICX|nr:uncharacterized protein TNCV_1529191 [Trichonephila clavipes]
MRRRLPPENVDDLARQLEQIWQEIPQETMRVLYHSMPRHVAACIRARGGPWVAYWLEHRTPDRKVRVRCPKPPNTLRVYTEYILVKSVGPKVLWAESRVQETGENFPPLQFHAKIVEVEIGGVAIYRPFWEFRRANLFCHLYGAQGQRQAYLLPR